MQPWQSNDGPSVPGAAKADPGERRLRAEAFASQPRGRDAGDAAALMRPKTRTFDYVWRSFVAGGLAGCVAKTVVAPLDRVKILFQASNPQFAKYTGSWFGVATAMKDIHRQDGPKGLYRGHSATLLRIFPYAAIKFVAYEQIRAVIIHSKDHETPFRRLVSGSLAGVTSVFCTYPLELIRVRLAFETRSQVRPSVVSICRQIYHERPHEQAPRATFKRAALFTAPIMLATSAPSSSSSSASASASASALENVKPSSGLINFYRGFTPTVLGMLPYAGMSFLTHDTVGDLLRHPSIAEWTTLPARKDSPPGKAAPLRSWAELLAGGLAGMVSQTSSYPLEVIRRRMQVGGAVGDGRRLRMAETMRIIMRERGLPGFFVGLTIGYAKTIPMVASSFFAYERLKLWLGI